MGEGVHPAHIVLARDVGADEQAADLLRDALARRLVEVGDDDLGTLLGETPRRRQPDAAGTPR
jgi:hypothetical protein